MSTVYNMHKEYTESLCIIADIHTRRFGVYCNHSRGMTRKAPEAGTHILVRQPACQVNSREDDPNPATPARGSPKGILKTHGPYTCDGSHNERAYSQEDDRDLAKYLHN